LCQRQSIEGQRKQKPSIKGIMQPTTAAKLGFDLYSGEGGSIHERKDKTRTRNEENIECQNLENYCNSEIIVCSFSVSTVYSSTTKEKRKIYTAKSY